MSLLTVNQSPQDARLSSSRTRRVGGNLHKQESDCHLIGGRELEVFTGDLVATLGGRCEPARLTPTVWVKEMMEEDKPVRACNPWEKKKRAECHLYAFNWPLMRIRRQWAVVSEVRDRIDIFATSTSGCWLDPEDNVNAATNADGLGKRNWREKKTRRVTLILPGKGGTGPQCISPEGNVPHTSRLEPPPRRYDPAGPDGEDHWRKASREKCMVSVPRFVDLTRSGDNDNLSDPSASQFIVVREPRANIGAAEASLRIFRASGLIVGCKHVALQRRDELCYGTVDKEEGRLLLRSREIRVRMLCYLCKKPVWERTTTHAKGPGISGFGVQLFAQLIDK
ncbi:hypothetical protein V8E53_011740 [Lactarius tabidus]